MSYSAHVGGLAAGVLLGVLGLQRRPVNDLLGTKRRAVAGVLLLVVVVLSIAWISSHTPPKALPWLYPDSNDWKHRTCCSKLDELKRSVEREREREG